MRPPVQAAPVSPRPVQAAPVPPRPVQAAPVPPRPVQAAREALPLITTLTLAGCPRAASIGASSADVHGVRRPTARFVCFDRREPAPAHQRGGGTPISSAGAAGTPVPRQP